VDPPRSDRVESSRAAQHDPSLPLPISSGGDSEIPSATADASSSSAPPNSSAPLATRRLEENEWQRVRRESGLTIQPRRKFILEPNPVSVSFPALQAARYRSMSRLQFDLGLSRPVEVEIGEIFDHSAAAYTLSGKIDGDPHSEFSVSVYEDAAVGTFRSAVFGIRQLRYVGAGVHKVEMIDPTLAPGCGTPITPALAAAISASSGDTGNDAPGDGPDSPPGVQFGPPIADVVLDVMVAYTQATINNEGSLNALLALINQGVADTNSTLNASNISARIRLVGTTELTYTETDPQAMLIALQLTDDGIMDAVHAERDQVGADFVCLWAPLSQLCGLAYRPSSISTGFAPLAFSVVDPDCQFKYTFTHELGHNFGCQHAVGDEGIARGGTLFEYSYGWRWNGTNGTQYRSVMAYAPGAVVRRFSNPDVSYQGRPSGRVDLEDNARSIRAIQDTLAQFRATQVDDHGDTAANATNVTLEAATPGNLENSADRDFFRFEIDEEMLLTIQSGGTTDTRANLRDSAQAIVATDDDEGAGGNFLIHTTLPAGTYFVEVTGQAGATGSYGLSVSILPPDDHGDILSEASPTPLPGSIAGDLENDNDDDYFRLDLPVDGTLTLATTGSTDTFGILRTGNGSILVSDDNDGTGENFQLTHVVPAGVHYLQVRGGTSSTIGAYEVLIAFEEWGDDHRNDFPGATVISPGSLSAPTQTPGSIEEAGDVDFFRFEVGGDNSWLVDTVAAERFTFDMEGPDAPLPGEQFTIYALQDSGFTIRTTSSAIIHEGSGNVDGAPGNPGNGTTKLRFFSPAALELRETGFSSFGVASVDLAEHHTSYPFPVNMTWYGYKVDGEIVSHTITTDGVIDGPGGVDDFETFIFPESFHDIYRLRTTASSVSIDNIVIDRVSGFMLDIEAGPDQPTASTEDVSVYRENDFALQPDDSSGSATILRTVSGEPASPNNGGAFLRVDESQSFELKDSNGRTFNAVHLDLAEFSSADSEPQEISWKGYRIDGSEVTHTFVTDGFNDGTLAGDDFETFYFPSTFTNITRLEALSHRFAVDNIRVTISDPASRSDGTLNVRSTGSTDTRADLYDELYNKILEDDQGGGGANFAIDTRLSPGTYYLGVSEFGDNAIGDYTLQLGYDGDLFPPAAPYGLRASDDDESAILLRWNGVFGPTTFDIYRHTNDHFPSATLIAGGIADDHLSDTSTVAGQTYFYWIVASNQDGTSPPSSPTTGTRPHPRPRITEQPEDLGIESGETVELQVTATANQGGLSYQWFVGESGDTSFPFGTDGDSISLANVSVPLKIWVRVSDEINSIDSDHAQVAILLPPPSLIAAGKALSTSAIRVRWLAVADATGYAIYRNTTDSAIGAVQVGVTSELSFDDTSAEEDRDYYYFVSAYNEYGVEGAISGGDPESESAHLGRLATNTLDGNLLPVGEIVDFAYSKDSKSLYYADRTGWVDEYSVADRKIVNSAGLGEAPAGIDVSPDGRRVIVAQATTAAGEGALQQFDFSRNPAQVSEHRFSLDQGESAAFDVMYLDAETALATARSPENTSLLRQINLTTGATLTRPDAATVDGRVGDKTFFARRAIRQADKLLSYHNDFEAGSASLADFTFTGNAEPKITVVNGQMRLDHTTRTERAVLHLPSIMPGFHPILADNDGGLITWAFNVSYDNSSTPVDFQMSLAYPSATPLGHEPGFRLSFGKTVGHRMGLATSNAFLIQTADGTPPRPEIGAFRITYDPQTHYWQFFYEQGPTTIDPLSVTTFIGGGGNYNQVNDALPYLQVASIDNPTAYVDNLSVTASDVFPLTEKTAVFQASTSSANWFGFDEQTNSFGPSGSHPEVQRFGAVNAVGSMFAVVDANATTIYGEDGEEIATLPFTGGVGFAPFAEQIYVVDDAADQIRGYSTVDWTEDFAWTIPGGVTATDEVFGQGRLEVRPDGLEVALSCGDGIRFFDLSTHLPSDAPLPPTQLSASEDSTEGSLLTWTASVVADTYTIYRHTSDNFSASTEIASSISDSTFTDNTATPGETYYYWVVACNEIGESDPSATDTGRLLVARPYSLSASDNLPDRIKLNWRVDGPTTGLFEIMRGTSNVYDQATPLGTSSALTYTDNSVNEGTGYYYWIRQSFAEHNSDFAGPTVGQLNLVAPANVTATTNFGSKVTISWQASPGAQEYEVYTGNSFVVDENDRFVGVTSSTSIDDSWENFPSNQPFYWAVRSKSGEAVSLFSSSAFGRRIIAPPTDVTASTDLPGSIRLTWTPSEDGQTEYRIFRSVDDNFATATQLAVIPAPATHWSDENATANSLYYYWVQSFKIADGIFAGAPGNSAAGIRIGGKFSDFIDEHSLTGDDSIPTSDPDKDGRTTLEEWALGGTNPYSSSSLPPLLLREVSIAGNTYPSLCHLRLINGTEVGSQYNTPELRYLAQGSSGGLDHWDLEPIPIPPPSDLSDPPTGYEWACFRLPGSLEQYPDGFLRVQLTLVEP